MNAEVPLKILKLIATSGHVVVQPVDLKELGLEVDAPLDGRVGAHRSGELDARAARRPLRAHGRREFQGLLRQELQFHRPCAVEKSCSPADLQADPGSSSEEQAGDFRVLRKLLALRFIAKPEGIPDAKEQVCHGAPAGDRRAQRSGQGQRLVIEAEPHVKQGGQRVWLGTDLQEHQIFDRNGQAHLRGIIRDPRCLRECLGGG